MAFRNLLNVKINLLGAIAVSVMASASTIVLSKVIDPLVNTNQMTPASGLAVTATSAVTCKEGVYSPVQKICVSQQVFDAEMQRLFAALGIDTSIYDLGGNNN